MSFLCDSFSDRASFSLPRTRWLLYWAALPLLRQRLRIGGGKCIIAEANIVGNFGKVSASSMNMNCFRQIQSGSRGARPRPESAYGRSIQGAMVAGFEHGRAERYTTGQGTGQLRAAVARASPCRITIRSWYGPATVAPQSASTRPHSNLKKMW